jgi:hypothetical protein
MVDFLSYRLPGRRLGGKNVSDHAMIVRIHTPARDAGWHIL